MTHVLNGKQSTDEQRMRGASRSSDAAREAHQKEAERQIRAINRRDAETQRGAA